MYAISRHSEHPWPQNALFYYIKRSIGYKMFKTRPKKTVKMYIKLSKKGKIMHILF